MIFFNSYQKSMYSLGSHVCSDTSTFLVPWVPYTTLPALSLLLTYTIVFTSGGPSSIKCTFSPECSIFTRIFYHRQICPSYQGRISVAVFRYLKIK